MTIHENASAIDLYGDLKAEAAEIANDLDNTKALLIGTIGEGAAEGERFRVALSHSLRSTTDWKAVVSTLAKEAGITDKRLDNLIAKHTSCAPTWVVRCSARVTKGE